MNKFLTAVACLALTVCTLFAEETTQAAAPRLTPGGIVLDCGELGRFTLLYPSFVLGNDYNKAQAKVEDNKAVITYQVPESPVIEMTLEGDVINATMKTGKAGKLNFGCYLPTSLAGKATAQLGKGGNKIEFPETQPTPPQLVQGENTFFELAGKTGKGFSLEFKEKGYWQLQDNRAWNWDIDLLTYKINVYGNRENQPFSLTVKLLP